MELVSHKLSIDLHCHSNASDGALTPTALLQHAIACKVDVLAITDHDTVAGFNEAKCYLDKENHQLQALNQPALPIQLISGIELSTTWQHRDIHIVGLNIDVTNVNLLAHLQAQEQHRYQRAQLIGQRLAKRRIENAFKGVEKLAQGGMITRAHFAQWLVEQNHVKTAQRAFDCYLSQGQSAYIPSAWQSIEHGIDLIHQAGGQAVLAHPSRYNLSAKWVKRLLRDFVAANGDAMEVAHAQQTREQRQLMTNYAKQFNLLASQGSDFHYVTPWIDLGRNLYLSGEVTPVWSRWS